MSKLSPFNSPESSSSIMKDVIKLAAAGATFTAYVPVQCTNELHGASMAKLVLSAEDVLHMRHLSSIAYKVGAPEITMALHCDWSSETIDSCFERFVIAPTESKNTDIPNILVGTDVSIQCHEACGTGLIVSWPLVLSDIAAKMIEAYKDGKSEILLDPEKKLTMSDLEDYFPAEDPPVNRPA